MSRRGHKKPALPEPADNLVAGIHAVLTALKTHPDAVACVRIAREARNPRLTELESHGRGPGRAPAARTSCPA